MHLPSRRSRKLGETDCSDGEDDERDGRVVCVDDVIDGRDETRSIGVEGGVPLFIFVETFRRRDIGPYTLNLSFTPSP